MTRAPRRRPRLVALLLTSLALSVSLVRGMAGAQAAPLTASEIPAAEAEAWAAVSEQRMIRARELGERVVAAAPGSYVGHLVLSLAQHMAEANFPRSLFHAERALAAFEARHGDDSDGSIATNPELWLWHARILRQLSIAHGDLGHHAERVSWIERFNERYSPQMVAEMAWPLMKMGRYAEARAAAERGLATNERTQTIIALNALCAVEFEGGRAGASYEACGQALAYSRANGRPSVVDLTNFAESAREAFELAESERALLEATELRTSSYGNPWLDLAELYTRSGRFVEAAQALQELPRWRARRPPHIRNSDRNESRRGIAGFLVAAGLHEAALDMTRQSMVTPDRRAHNSRDPAQDRSLSALLHRRALRASAESVIEKASAGAWYERLGAHVEAAQLRFEAWQTGRAATRILTANDETLIGLLQVGTSRSGVTPPWLVGELVDLFGAGVLEAALDRAREQDRRPAAAPYHAALAAEIAATQGDEPALREHAAQAIAGLGAGDALLRARVLALLAAAGRYQRFEEVLGIDPGVFRRVEVAVPVRITTSGDAIARDVAAALRRSPRFDVTSDASLELRIEATAAGGQVCLLGRGGRVFGCGRAGLEHDDDDRRSLAQRLVDATHEAAFSPRVDLTQADIHSLDGAGGTTRNPLDALRRP